jgi:hypothetical protein
MMLDWMLHPVLQYGLLGAGLGLCLYLFFTLKVELAKLDRRHQDIHDELSRAVSGLRAELDQARAQMCELQEQSKMLVPPAPTTSGLNLSKRGQVLQMHRRGQSAEQIAASLALPKTEVDLLLKVHQIVLEQVG